MSDTVWVECATESSSFCKSLLLIARLSETTHSIILARSAVFSTSQGVAVIDNDTISRKCISHERLAEILNRLMGHRTAQCMGGLAHARWVVCMSYNVQCFTWDWSISMNNYFIKTDFKKSTVGPTSWGIYRPSGFGCKYKWTTRLANLKILYLRKVFESVWRHWHASGNINQMFGTFLDALYVNK